MTTKPTGPHRETLRTHGFVIREVTRGGGAALFFPKLRERAIADRLDALAAGLRFTEADSEEAGIIQRTAEDPRAFLRWVYRNESIVRELIAAVREAAP
jgi:hypothetical protein